MSHEDLAFKFCGFVDNFIKEIDHISFIDKNDEIFYRVCLQKLYYALYHKMLQHDVALSESNAPNQHETIYKKLLKNDPKLAQLYEKMKSLRVWADYKLDEIPKSALDLNYLQYQVYKVLRRKTINI